MAEAKFHLDEEERESLVCGICLEYYDNDCRVPKFLQCFHTCCLQCLKTQTKNQKITCPFCRQTMTMNKPAEQLTTNFYILPKVQKLGLLRKQLEELCEKSKINWAKAIALRRSVESKLKHVYDSCRLLESIITQKIEENNEKIVILQSLIEEPHKADIDELLSKNDRFESELSDSEKELSSAELSSQSFDEVENMICNLTLEDRSDGSKSVYETLRNQPLSFNSVSAQHGPYVGAANSLLSFILYYLKESNCLETVSEENLPLFKETGINNTTSAIRNAHDEPNRRTRDNSNSSSSELSTSPNHYLCYMQFRVNGNVKPVVVIDLDTEEAPIMCETFLSYCLGNNNLTYRNTRIFKTGDSITGGKFNELKSVTTGTLNREKEQRYVADLSSLNEVKGAIRMRHRGRNEQGVLVSSEFSIICNDAHLNLDQMTTVFGHVVRGMEVCEEVSKINTANSDVVIYACGSWPISD